MRRIGVALWVVQALLAALFVFAGGIKLIMPAAMLAAQSPLPVAFLKFVGAAEVLGALGLVLPGLFRIRTGLTPLAAGGLVVIMIGATVTTVATMGILPALFPAIVGVLTCGVMYGRWRIAPLDDGRAAPPGGDRSLRPEARDRAPRVSG